MKYDIPCPMDILTSPQTKTQLKSLIRTKISTFWHNELKSKCSLFSSLKYFNPIDLQPLTPHPIVSTSGCSEYLNKKCSVNIKLLSGRYRLNTLRQKFSPNISPKCHMCQMNTDEDLPHFLLQCPYLDGSREYTLLKWSNHASTPNTPKLSKTS